MLISPFREDIESVVTRRYKKMFLKNSYIQKSDLRKVEDF